MFISSSSAMEYFSAFSIPNNHETSSINISIVLPCFT